MRDILTLLQGEDFASQADLQTKLDELIARGDLSAKAEALNQDDPKWRAQELAYEAMEADDLFEALRLVAEAQKLDPDCTDAQRLMVSLAPMEPESSIKLMRIVVDKAERNLGEAFFAENTGHFWGVFSTRPYMRAIEALGDLLTNADRLEDAIAVYERMLELNPNDNQGVRNRLLGLYLATKQTQAAHGLLSRYADEEKISAVFAWGRVIERWLSDQPAEARSALLRARNVNRFVEGYLAGARKPPQQLPSTHSIGGDSEAQVAVAELSPALVRLREFTSWLRERS